MAKRTYRPEQIIKKLREAEVLLSQGSTIGEAARKIRGNRVNLLSLAKRIRWDEDWASKKTPRTWEGKCPAQEDSNRSFLRQWYSEGSITDKLLRWSKRRKIVDRVLRTLNIWKRRACQVLGQARTTQRHSSYIRNDEQRLVARTIELITQYGRYGYCRIIALLKQEGWKVNHKRIERIWRKEYNQVRPHSALNYRVPLPEAIIPLTLT